MTRGVPVLDFAQGTISRITIADVRVGDIFIDPYYIVSTPRNNVDLSRLVQIKKDEGETEEEYIQSLEDSESATGHFAEHFWCEDVLHEYPFDETTGHIVQPKYTFREWQLVTSVDASTINTKSIDRDSQKEKGATRLWSVCQPSKPLYLYQPKQ
jgi:hypothetical protein